MTAPMCDSDDLEQYAGDSIPFPWDDPEQPDWPETEALAPSWIVVASLNSLLQEINTIAPNRDRSSDGSVGDTSHAAGPSDHNPDETGNPESTDADSINEVRARDFDKDLNQPGLTMEMIAQYLVQESRAGRITWIRYIIFNRRIWSASRDWVTRTYTGSNPHDKHMHVSCRPDTASENSTRSLGLETLVEGPGMELNDKVGSKPYPNRTVKDFFTDWWSVRDTLINDARGKVIPAADSPFGQLITMVRDYPRLKAEVAAITEAVGAKGAATEDAATDDAATDGQNAATVYAVLTEGTPEQSAEVLRAILGDRAAEVGRRLGGDA